MWCWVTSPRVTQVVSFSNYFVTLHVSNVSVSQSVWLICCVDFSPLTVSTLEQFCIEQSKGVNTNTIYLPNLGMTSTGFLGTFIVSFWTIKNLNLKRILFHVSTEQLNKIYWRNKKYHQICEKFWTDRRRLFFSDYKNLVNFQVRKHYCFSGFCCQCC